MRLSLKYNSSLAGSVLYLKSLDLPDIDILKFDFLDPPSRPLDGQRRRETRQDYKNLRRALCVGYARQLAERMIHHNGYWTLGCKPQLVQVHPSSVLQADDDGKLPNYVGYHKLIRISRSFMRNVCAVEMSWVMPILKKLEKVDVNKLSGGIATSEDNLKEEVIDLPKKEADIVNLPDDRNSQI